MLPFGSITSIIPLFVLAVAYLAYIATAAFNKPIVTVADDPDHQLKEPVRELSTTLLHKDLPDFRSAMEEEPEIIVIPDVGNHTFNIHHEFPDTFLPERPFKNIEQFCGFNLSSRPPPSLA